MMSKRNDPLYPIDANDYPKLFDYVLTKDGLLYFHSLRRNYLLGKELSQDECNKIRLLYVYYATANRNPDEVFAWQDLCLTLDNMGIIEKDMFQSKQKTKSNFSNERVRDQELSSKSLYQKSNNSHSTRAECVHNRRRDG